MSEPHDPPRLGDDPNGADSFASDLRAARRAAPSPAEIADILKAVQSNAATPVAKSNASTPPPSNTSGFQNAAFWLVGAVILLGGVLWLRPRPEVTETPPHATPAVLALVDSAVSEPDVAPMIAVEHDAAAPATPDAALLVAPITVVDAGVRCVAVEHERRLRRAQGALAQGSFALALATANEDRAQCPRATFSEEQERIAVEALLRIGRRSEAQLRLRAFQRRFPSSLYLHSLQVLLSDER